MTEKLFLMGVIIIFLYFIYQQYIFQSSLFFNSQEGFTPQQVNAIIQPPGSYEIGTADSNYLKQTQILTVSNGYTEEIINRLKTSNPEAFDRETTDTMGDFPGAEQEKYALPTTEFEYPNDYKFTVDYKCRKSATGMFSDCGVYSANTAWTADPYKGLNCPLTNTKTPEISSSIFTKRETKYGEPRPSGISGTGNSMLR
jgi:hypothetical protein